jgi:FdhE protein
MNRPSWDQRITRAEELKEVYPFASEVLCFYVAISRFQKGLYGYVRQARDKAPPPHSFRAALDLAILLPRFPGFLNTVEESAPPALAAFAEEFSGEGKDRWEELLCSFWLGSRLSHRSPSNTFLARGFLQPYAEFLSERLPEPLLSGPRASCPVCESEPVVGVLRQEQLGGRRSLICSLCAYEWNFPRTLCPGCGEDRNDALAVFASELFEHVRVEACDTCKWYIKTVDLTTNGLAVPAVDELAAVPLTLWAQENGYSKMQTNLLAV